LGNRRLAAYDGAPGPCELGAVSCLPSAVHTLFPPLTRYPGPLFWLKLCRRAISSSRDASDEASWTGAAGAGTVVVVLEAGGASSTRALGGGLFTSGAAFTFFGITIPCSCFCPVVRQFPAGAAATPPCRRASSPMPPLGTGFRLTTTVVFLGT